MGESPFIGPNNRAEFRDNFGSTFLDRQGGQLEKSDDGGTTFRPFSAPRVFEADTLAIAQHYMPAVAFNRVTGSTGAPAWEFAVPASNPPVIDVKFSDGVMVFPAAASQLALNPVTPASATYNPILGNFSAQGSPWLVRGRFLLNASAFTTATNLAFLSLEGSGVGGPGATFYVQFASDGTTDLRQTYIRMRNGAAVQLVSTGPDGLLGGLGGIPVNQYFVLTLYFDGINVRWMVNDQPNPLNLLNAGTGQMDQFPEPSPNASFSVVTSNTDTVAGPLFSVDALAIAYTAPQENR